MVLINTWNEDGCQIVWFIFKNDMRQTMQLFLLSFLFLFLIETFA
ncbi:hypothetical protein BTHERMOSOX_284 [Bathymodiolus thermophilus thioautotrophic gill symbiont]|nr:hypothetical protein BTHERMOSOX_284 [Bathymodiolus thermophilus thioautotrophic gill symbiont]